MQMSREQAIKMLADVVRVKHELEVAEAAIQKGLEKDKDVITVTIPALKR